MGLIEKHLEESIEVRTKDEFQEAADKFYGKIIPTGWLADELETKMKRNKVGNAASNLTMVAGLFFWPALIVGFAGKVMTASLNKYSVHADESDHIYFKIKDQFLPKELR